MLKHSESEYIFANAYIGSFVSRLMTGRDIRRVAASRDLAGAALILHEFGYEDGYEDDKYLHEGAVEPFLRRERNDLYKEVFSVLPDRRALAFNLLPYDYGNLKICLKAEQLGTMPERQRGFMSEAGTIAPAALIALVRDRSYDRMPVEMAQGIREALDIFARSHDPQSIDLALDRACCRHMLEEARETQDTFLIDYVKMQMDAVNLSAWMRLREMGRPWSALRDVFVEGAHITLPMLTAGYEEPASRMAERLAPFGFGEAVAEGGQMLKESGSMAAFERLRDDAVMQYVKRAKFESFGIHPIQGYLYAKETEIANLRVALSGILFGFTSAEIEERLKESYV